MSARWAWACLLLASPASAFWGKNHGDMIDWVMQQGTWPAFQRGSRNVDKVDAYLKQVLYLRDGTQQSLNGVTFSTPSCMTIRFVPVLTCSPPNDKPTDRPNKKLPFIEWAKEGGLAEDGFRSQLDGALFAGVRAVNHFHTPFTSKSHPEGGFTGVFPGGVNLPLTVPFLEGLFRPGISAADWANGASSGGQTNNWGWPAAHQSYRRFFTEQTRVKRERGLAAAARALGQVQHLIEDNAIPDHSRDLAHPFTCFEDFIKAHESAIYDKTEWTKFRLSAIEAAGFRGFWDRDVYNGSNPSVTQTDSDPPGISEYSNANFFAFNENELDWRFSDIPEQASSWTQFPNPTWLVSNDVYVPPAPPKAVDVVARKPDPLGVQPVADPHMWLDDHVWAAYATPLVKHLLGYSLATWPLLLPPARAEIVPDPAAPMTQAKVRLWNLGTSPEYGYTWHLDAVSVLPIVPDGLSTNLFGTNEELTADFGGATVPPGGYVESRPFVIDVNHRTFFYYAAYTAVLVNAHLGDTKQTPIEFGVPIPNGFPLLQQLDLQDMSTPATVNKTCGTNMTCGPDAIGLVLRVPFQQHLKMKLALKGPKVDLLNNRLGGADAELISAIQEDTHLAGIGVGSYIATNGAFPDLSMIRYPVSSAFTVAPGDPLMPGSKPATYFRQPAMVEAPDPQNVPLELNLDLRDFITVDSDAPQASNNTQLVVWTTSGAMYLMRLLLWPVTDKKDAATAAMNLTGCTPAVTSAAYVNAAACNVTNGTTCATNQYSYAWQYTPATGVLGFVSGGNGLQAAAAASLEVLLQMGITSAGSTMIAADSKGADPTLCAPADFTFYNQSSTAACSPGAGTFAHQSTFSMGNKCTSLPASQSVSPHATFVPLYTNADDYLWHTVFNRPKSELPTWTLTAH